MKKVLVIDDTNFQREVAMAQLDGKVELQVVGSFHEAKKAIMNNSYDYVLTDLMMPAEDIGGTPEAKREVGKPTPYGFPVAMLALKHGVKKVAIVSNGQYDANHHTHPVFGACDHITGKVTEQLFIFAGYSCPTMEDGDFIADAEKPYQVKDWNFVLECIETGEHKEKHKKSRTIRL